jgi:hypothetical protein
LTLGLPQVQYSDRQTFTATVSAPGAATDVTFRIGTVVVGTAPVDATGRATLDAQLLGAIPPGSRIVTAVFTGVSPNYTVTNPMRSFTVRPEDATVAYSGAPTLQRSGGTVVLTATVTDMADGNRGNVGNATVAFINRSTGATIGTATVVPTGDGTTGTATFTWTTGTGTYNIGFSVGNYYVRNNTADNRTITVTN